MGRTSDAEKKICIAYAEAPQCVGLAPVIGIASAVSPRDGFGLLRCQIGETPHLSVQGSQSACEGSEGGIVF